MDLPTASDAPDERMTQTNVGQCDIEGTPDNVIEVWIMPCLSYLQIARMRPTSSTLRRWCDHEFASIRTLDARYSNNCSRYIKPNPSRAPMFPSFDDGRRFPTLYSSATDAALQFYSTKCGRLDTVNLTFSSTRVTGAGLHALLDEPECSVDQLDVSCCPSVCDDAILQLSTAYNWTFISNLELEGCDVSDRALRIISETMPYLSGLNVRGATGIISDAGVRLIASGCEDLRVLCIPGCPGVSMESLDLIIQHTDIVNLSIEGCGIDGTDLIRCLSLHRADEMICLSVDELDADDVDRLIETQGSLQHLCTCDQISSSAVQSLESKGIDYMCFKY